MGTQTPSIRSLLENMIEWGDRLEAITGDITFDHFQTDPAAAPGASKCIEVIGEAALRILKYHPGFAAEHPELELVEAYRMRNNRLVNCLQSIPRRSCGIEFNCQKSPGVIGR